MLIDTHCHLDLIIKTTENSFLSPVNFQQAFDVAEEAAQKNVEQIITIGTNYQRSLQSIALAEKVPGVSAAIGIHPCDITVDWKTDFEKIKHLTQEKKQQTVVGIGETGLDFYHPGFVVQRQEDAFKAHIELALEHNLALVVHTRSAIDETLKILQEYHNTPLKGVVHCFSEQWSLAQDIISMNFMLGIGGIVTYPKNEYLREILRKNGLKNIVLETDSPFLPPQEIRGKQNRPVQIRTIAEYIADLLDLSWQEVAEQTTANAAKLFFE